MSTADRVLSILSLFTIDHPEWTVDALALELGLSGSTAYQYVRSLNDAGLLVSSKAGRYTVGPAIIELDRITRRFDPLSNAARATLQDLTAGVESEAIGLLCRLYRLKVICVEQVTVSPPSFGISYERGRPMQLTRGAASKIILGNLTSRPLRRFYEGDPDAVRDAKLGDNWDEFKRSIRYLRRQPALATIGELDSGLMGMSAPVFDADGTILGSIGLVVSAAKFESDKALYDETMAAVASAGKSVTALLSSP